jgi:hypothetical protein
MNDPPLFGEVQRRDIILLFMSEKKIIRLKTPGHGRQLYRKSP